MRLLLVAVAVVVAVALRLRRRRPFVNRWDDEWEFHSDVYFDELMNPGADHA